MPFRVPAYFTDLEVEVADPTDRRHLQDYIDWLNKETRLAYVAYAALPPVEEIDPPPQEPAQEKPQEPAK